MNKILYRTSTESSGRNLFSSIDHYNNLSPMFRGPATSNTLIEISKVCLNKQQKTKCANLPARYKKMQKMLKDKFENK